MSDQITQQKRRMRSGKKPSFRNKEEVQFDTVPISIRRVTKVGAGSKRMRFSVAVVAGDRKGRVGMGLGKGPDVRTAMEKAIRNAKRNLIIVPIVGTTIPHEIKMKVGAAEVLLMPALPGTGVIAGGAIRSVVELAGVRDLLSKRRGAKNQLNNVYATIEALKHLEGAKVDGSFKVKSMYSDVKIETLAAKDKKFVEKKRFEKKPFKKDFKKSEKPEVRAEVKVEKVSEEVKEENK